jgi:hypothetical protein
LLRKDLSLSATTLRPLDLVPSSKSQITDLCECASASCSHLSGRCLEYASATLYRAGYEEYKLRVCADCGNDPTTKALTRRVEDKPS